MFDPWWGNQISNATSKTRSSQISKFFLFFNVLRAPLCAEEGSRAQNSQSLLSPSIHPSREAINEQKNDMCVKQ